VFVEGECVSDTTGAEEDGGEEVVVGGVAGAETFACALRGGGC